MKHWPVYLNKLITCLDAVCFFLLLGTLSYNDSHGYENVTYKVKSRCLKFYRAYSVSHPIRQMLSIVFWRWILKDYIEVQEEKKKVVALCSRPLENVKLDTFTL